ncbi:MAG: hypothetical protein HEEMFOPI_01903 [Holosporales bacterium]
MFVYGSENTFQEEQTSLELADSVSAVLEEGVSTEQKEPEQTPLELVGSVPAVLEDGVKAEPVVKSNQIFGPFFEFQKLPKDKKFIVVSEISNVISFSKKEKGVSTTYHMLVVKAYPFLSKTCLEGVGDDIKYPIYAAFISPLYKNDWCLFTHFDPLLGQIYTIPYQSLSLILQCIQAEINLFLPSLKVRDGESSKVFDISCVCPTKWKKMIYALLSPHKGMDESIYSTTYDPQNKGTYSSLKITRHKVFDDLEDGNIDIFVDIYRPLAALQPFWIVEDFSEILFNQFGSDIFAYQFAEFPLTFSNIGKPLPDCVPDGYVFGARKEHHYPLTIRKLAESIESNIKNEIDKIEDPKEKMRKRIHMRSYMNEADFREMFKSHQHHKITSTDRLISFSHLSDFLMMVQQRSKTIEQEKQDYEREKGVLLSFFQKIPESDREGEVDEIFQKFLKRTDAITLLKTKEDEVFRFEEVPFDAYLKNASSQKMLDLFQRQVCLITEDVDQLISIQYKTFVDQLEYMLEWLLIFYQFHQSAVTLGVNFEVYFEKFEKELAQLENNDVLLSYEERLEVAAKHQMRESILEIYNTYQDLILSIRSIYPNIGYIPKQFQCDQMAEKESLTKSDEKKSVAPQQIENKAEAIDLPAGIGLPSTASPPLIEEKTEEQRLKDLKKEGKKVSLKDMQQVAKLRLKKDPTS